MFEIPPASTSPPSAAEGRGGGKAGELIEEVGRVVKEGLGGWGWDGVVVAVGVGRDEEGEWEERCAEGGMELVVLTGKEVEGARNEFGGTSLLSFYDFLLSALSTLSGLDEERAEQDRS